MKNIFGNNLKILREDRGMTKNQLSCKIGVHHDMIKQYETGKAKPSIDVLGKLCNSLRCFVSSYFTTTQENKSEKAWLIISLL